MTALWGNSFKYFSPCLKALWPWFVFVYGSQELFNFLTVQSLGTDDNGRIAGLVLNLILVLVLQLLSTIVVLQTVKSTVHGLDIKLVEQIKKHLKYVIIEFWRSLLSIVLWSLLLLIPGIIQALKLYFVTFVVQFDENYQKGQVDALEKSRELMGISFFSSAALIIAVGIIAMAGHLTLDYFSITESPFGYFGGALLAIFTNLYSYIFGYLLYEWLVAKGKNNGNEISA